MSNRPLLALFLAFAWSACLPAGDPPSGRHLVVGRELSRVFYSPSGDLGGPSHLLALGLEHPFQGDSSGRPVLDLMKLPTDSPLGAPMDPAGLSIVRRDLVPASKLPKGEVFPPSDSLGRLLLLQADPGFSQSVWRVDPATSEAFFIGRLDWLGDETNIVLSPNRNRVVVGINEFVVTELDGFQIPLGPTDDDPLFLDDDIYVDRPAGEMDEPGIWRVRPHGMPERIATNARFSRYSVSRELSLAWIPSMAGKRLLLERSDKSSIYQAYSLFDPDSLEETSLTSLTDKASLFSMAPSGRWLLFKHMPKEPSAPITLDVLDMAGPSVLLPLTDATTNRNPEWRPGEDEVWMGEEEGKITIWNPNQGLRVVAGNSHLVHRGSSIEASSFTQDGRFWFSNDGMPGTAVRLQSADQPEDPGILVTPEKSWVDSYWDVSDGRLLFALATTSPTRANAKLIDPVRRTEREFVLHGRIIAVGRTRFLALVDWEESLACGVLALIDLASGSRTLLAENVTSVAVDGWTATGTATTDDPLAPGTRVAFLSQNRMASPYDGLWTVELP